MSKLNEKLAIITGTGLGLSYSRKAYSGAVSRQDTETFLRCLENGLRSFGGSPLLLNLDNLKAAVLKADWFDPAASFPL